ncbi:2515_t:CDS:2 [Diversispora eburnea]|uniref:2515_t:CDS:1 n=1 Tax=Diversispora eburnea TaxID=1213867 RepID=A0A9N8YYX0_9GLOM|nr:2515_t:CDS:2 [Diversispora eburnea]
MNSSSPWRKGIYSTLGILTFIYFTTTSILFYKRRNKIPDIQFRPLRLSLINAFATTLLCLMICFHSAFGPKEFPCLFVYWISSIGNIIVHVSVTCRAIAFVWVAKYNFEKLRMNISYLSLPQTPITPGFNGMNRLKKFEPYVTDDWLTTWIVCPALIVDAYGLRKEILILMIGGPLGTIVYFIWEFTFPELYDILAGFIFAWLSLVLGHTLSITYPVWKSYKEPLNAYNSSTTSLNQEDIPKSTEKSNLKSKKYESFEKVLSDSELFECYKRCAAACFCTELVLFLQEYQYLKFLVIRCCTPSNNNELSLPQTPKFTVRENGHISFPGSIKFLSANGPSLPPFSPSFVTDTTPCTKSITETVTAASWIPFPYELKLDYKTFYDTYLDPNSDLAINFSGNLLNKIKEMIKKDQYELSMYEQAREDVLMLLYVNTFEKFLKMGGTEVKNKMEKL